MKIRGPFIKILIELEVSKLSIPLVSLRICYFKGSMCRMQSVEITKERGEKYIIVSEP